MQNSVTVLVHGTFSRRVGGWHRPGSRFQRYIRRNVFHDVYNQDDPFEWSGGASDAARLEGANRLIQWCNEHDAETYNFISHSHGTNVVNLATHRGLKRVGKLVHLSPPVCPNKEGYLPNLEVVASEKLFNFHARIDNVVTVLARRTCADVQQNFDGTLVDDHEVEVVIAPVGHWAPLRVRVWKSHDLDEIVVNEALHESHDLHEDSNGHSPSTEDE